MEMAPTPIGCSKPFLALQMLHRGPCLAPTFGTREECVEGPSLAWATLLVSVDFKSSHSRRQQQRRMRGKRQWPSPSPSPSWSRVTWQTRSRATGRLTGPGRRPLRAASGLQAALVGRRWWIPSGITPCRRSWGKACSGWDFLGPSIRAVSLS
ncbi:hypothetical protein GQ53DRAFT_866474, partial [Thozetella sp. PMI_491]